MSKKYMIARHIEFGNDIHFLERMHDVTYICFSSEPKDALEFDTLETAEEAKEYLCAEYPDYTWCVLIKN